MRITVRASTTEAAREALALEERAVRADLESRVGDVVFAADDETMEDAVAERLVARSLTVAVAESVTGGLIASRLVNVVGASNWFRGGVVSYAADVKRDLLSVPNGPVITAEAAESMATGVRTRVGSDVGLAVTGVAGPEQEEGVEVGTVFVGLSIDGRITRSVRLRLPGDRLRVREYATISALDVLRRALDERPG